jgi:hypothetical protein
VYSNEPSDSKTNKKHEFLEAITEKCSRSCCVIKIITYTHFVEGQAHIILE